MEAILSGVQVILAVVLIVLILMHSGKDAGLSGAFGVGTGAGPLGGGSLVERNLNRWTIFFAVLFAINVLVLLKSPEDPAALMASAPSRRRRSAPPTLTRAPVNLTAFARSAGHTTPYAKRRP